MSLEMIGQPKGQSLLVTDCILSFCPQSALCLLGHCSSLLATRSLDTVRNAFLLMMLDTPRTDTPLGWHPGQISPWADTTPRQTAPLGRRTPWADTSPRAGTPLRADTLPQAPLQWMVRILLECFLVIIRNIVAARSCFHKHLSFCSQGEGVPGQTPPGRNSPWQTTPPPHPPGRPPPTQQTATAVDGTHPAGMHSCYNLFLQG